MFDTHPLTMVGMNTIKEIIFQDTMFYQDVGTMLWYNTTTATILYHTMSNDNFVTITNADTIVANMRAPSRQFTRSFL